MIKFIKEKLLHSCQFLARTDIFFMLCFWLIILLVAGTIAQKDIGLFAAQEKYFSSYIIWLGDILPVPGGYPIMAVMTIGLICKTALEKWRKENFGTFVTHIAVIMLLVGGFLTAFFSKEGYMVIPENDRTNYFSSYYDLELAIIEVGKEEDFVTTFDETLFKQGDALQHESLPFYIRVENYFENAQISKLNEPLKMEFAHPSSNAYTLKELPVLKEVEMNQSGMTLTVNINSYRRHYTLFEDMIHTPTVQVGDKVYKLELRHKRTYLPFYVQLDNFTKLTYTSSMEAQNYKSNVHVIDGDINFKSLIEMNEPLRYKGYTLFQSSYIQGAEDTTVLAVVHNVGRLFPYISSILICIGLLIHLFIRLPRLIRKSSIALFMAMFISQSALAIDIDKTNFNQIPVLEDGRIKPFQTFARNKLTTFNGKNAIEGMNAQTWLAEVLFHPEASYKREIFNIDNPDVIEILSLPKREGRRYSFKEVVMSTRDSLELIKSIENIAQEERTLEQSQLLTLYYNTIHYYEISRSFSFILPMFIIQEKQLAESLGVEHLRAYNFLEISTVESKLAAEFNKLRQIHPDNAEPWQKEVYYQYQLFNKIKQDKQSKAFKIIPAQWGDLNEWFSPWDTFTMGQGSPKTSEFFDTWKNVALAYNAGNQNTFTTWINKVNQDALNLTKAGPSKLYAEVLYNNLELFDLALAVYLLALLLTAIWAFSETRIIRRAAIELVKIGAGFHIVGIGLRMFIMERPPVATLYESVIFVSIVAVIFGLIFEARKKDGVGLFISALSGTILQFIAMRYSVQGDTMGNLVAVLNTNFWLATHVVTITIGYGCCLVAGVLAHIFLYQRMRRPENRKPLDTLTKNMLGASLIALFFSVLGTILGGIWADQSWGRFWGWDPKENGALLICLWLILLLHGRIAGLLRPFHFAVGIALTNIIVAIAWFGVNLLGVGLHSYGFTENIATNLGIFIGAELIIIAALMLGNYIKTGNKRVLK